MMTHDPFGAESRHSDNLLQAYRTAVEWVQKMRALSLPAGVNLDDPTAAEIKRTLREHRAVCEEMEKITLGAIPYCGGHAAFQRCLQDKADELRRVITWVGKVIATMADDYENADEYERQEFFAPDVYFDPDVMDFSTLGICGNERLVQLMKAMAEELRC